MIRHYFTVAIRNAYKRGVYSIINVVGFGLGLACSSIILLYVQRELQFDRFSDRANRIFRVLRESTDGSGTAVQAGTSGPLGPALLEDFPEIEQVVQVSGYGDQLWTLYDGQNRYHGAGSVWMATEGFLEFFDLHMVYGNGETALHEPYSMVMSEDVARAYFGDRDAIGEIVQVESSWAEGHYKVTGVVRIPRESSLRFDILYSRRTPIPSNWLRRQWEEWQVTNRLRPIQTFVLLRNNGDAMALDSKLQSFVTRRIGTQSSEGNRYHLQAITRIHLYTSRDYPDVALGIDREFLGIEYGDITEVYIFSAIAFLILGIASANYVNLATARASMRADEMAIRYALGANVGNLIRQLLSEFLVVAVASLILALGLMEVADNHGILLGLGLSVNFTMSTMITVGLLAVFSGIAAGGYSAIVVTRFTLNQAFTRHSTGTYKIRLWKRFVVVQHSIAILLVILALTVHRQVSHLQSKELGFEPQGLIQIPIFRLDRTRKVEDMTTHLAARYGTVKEAFLDCAGVIQATAHREAMGAQGGVMRDIVLDGGDVLRALVQEADEDFVSTYGLELLEGRTFGRAGLVGEVQLIVNERVTKRQGERAGVGEIFGPGTIVGVVRDFNSRPLREEIGPYIIRNRSLFNYLTLRIRQESIDSTLSSIESKWYEFVPDRPFEYSFVETTLHHAYQPERTFGSLIGGFSVLAVFVASLGLFGIAAFTLAEQKKTIGIRKVLGSSIHNVILRLSWEYLRLVIMANLLAWPLAYYLSERWLREFPYRVDQEVWVYLASGCFALTVALGTVFLHSLKAATTNPAEVLRHR